MPREYIWMVSSDGVPWRIPVIEDPNCVSQVEWESVPCSNSSIRSIVASPTSVFAIDHTGRVLLLVLPSHIAIRNRIEVYVNERWYPIVKWRRPLPTDRYQYSDESGRLKLEPSDFDVSDGWSWEEPWSTHMDPRSFDSDGWQYSISFIGSKWSNVCRRQHFVRRKILKRHMRYTSHDKWVELSNDAPVMFTEIAIGGFEILSDGEVLLFALGTDGEIYRRNGIRAHKPTGSNWVRIPKIITVNHEVDDVTLITASSSLGTLIAVTWDGKLFYRQGISRNYPSGLTWLPLKTPRNKAVICASIGTNSMWCLTADGFVWFTRVEVDPRNKEQLLSKITSNDYQEVLQSGVCRLSVTKNDQVVCISSDTESIKVRTGICDNEPSGKRFEKMIERCDGGNLRFISIHSGACSFLNVPDYFVNDSVLQTKTELTSFKKTEWRNRILNSLIDANNRSWIPMNDIKCDELIDKEWEDGKENQNIKKSRCQLNIGGVYQSVTVHTTSEFMEIIASDKLQIILDMSKVLFAVPQFQRLPQKYMLVVAILGDPELYRFAFTDESSRNNFQISVENVIRSSITETTRSSNKESMWSVGLDGAIRWHCLSVLNSEFESLIPVGESKSLMVGGHFEEIDCGDQRIVWARNSSGNLYSLSVSYDPLSQHDNDSEYTLIDEVTYEMYEYQKYATFRGFITFQGIHKGVSAWMCDSHPVPEAFSSLPTKEWSWIDNGWQLEDEEWQYATDITAEYKSSGKEEGNARRRLWKRKARFESKKSPWCLVESPKLRCVRVAKKTNKNGTVMVIVLTMSGEILMRHGVKRDCFIGNCWSQIVSDVPISCIDIQDNMKLWCASHDGLILWKGIDNNEVVSEDWSYVAADGLSNLKDLFLDNLKDQTNLNIASSSNIVYVRIRNILFRIDTINNNLSDGYAVENLQQCTKNSKGFIVLRGENISIVHEWNIVPYCDRKAAIISMKRADIGKQLGRGIKCISMY